MTSKQLVEAGRTVQDQSKQSTARTKQVIETTINIGQATNAALQQQTEQLGRVDAQLDVLESNLTRADKQIQFF